MTTPAKLPFNDYQHLPTRPEIDTLLGVLPALELKRFEERLDLLEPTVSWAMHWYDSEQGWGYRASFRSRSFSSRNAENVASSCDMIFSR